MLAAADTRLPTRAPGAAAGDHPARASRGGGRRPGARLYAQRRRPTLFFALAAVLAACAQPSPREGDAPPVAVSPTDFTLVSAEGSAAAATPRLQGDASEGVDLSREAGGPSRPKLQPMVKRGTGYFIKPPTEISAPLRSASDEGVTLNFEGTPLREVVETILGNVLQEPYVIADGVTGAVTMRTPRPLAREDLLAVLESLLHLNGAALVRRETGYEVVPLAGQGGAGAPLPARVGGVQGLGAGFGIQIVPLRYVAAPEMQKILEPLVSGATSVRADAERNLLILTGPQRSLATLLEAIDIFDVNWLRGLSVGIYPMEFSDAGLIADELEGILGGQDGPSLKGVVRVSAIERLNAVMIITKQPQYLDDLRSLIQNFDRGYDAPRSGRRLYVYNMQNAKADYVGGLLDGIFGGGGGGAGGQRGLTDRSPLGSPLAGESLSYEVAVDTGTAGGMVEGGGGAGAAGLGGGSGGSSLAADSGATPARATSRSRRGGASRTGGAGRLGETESPIDIIPDVDNNSLLIMATPRDYRLVEAALRRLDLRRRQVLIQTIIAEVALTGELNYGVQWYLEGRIGGLKNLFNFQGLPGQIPAAVGGAGQFSYSLSNANGVKFLIDLLAGETQVRFLSAPQVLVIDNQTASITVGDSIPVTVRSSNAVSGNTIVSETQYRDTGTILRVTPHINAGGVVTMEISQEVSIPGASAGGDNPPISQRTVQSTVVVESGQAITLGGLIREASNLGEKGLPGLKDLPFLGVLFGNKSSTTGRTELLITIAPTVIEDQLQASEATAELRQVMSSASRYVEETQHGRRRSSTERLLNMVRDREP